MKYFQYIRVVEYYIKLSHFFPNLENIDNKVLLPRRQLHQASQAIITFVGMLQINSHLLLVFQ